LTKLNNNNYMKNKKWLFNIFFLLFSVQLSFGLELTQLGADIDGEASGDGSGYSVSMNADGGTVAIGAYFNDGNGDYSGHVRIYQWNGSSWQQLGLDIDGEAAGDRSGWSVSLSADGGTVAIGAYTNDGNGDFSGHVRIYQWSGSSWQQQGADIDGEAAGDYSGYSVSLSADGGTVAIGTPYNDGNGSHSGHVRIYQWDGSSWQQQGADIDGEAAVDHSGWSVSLSADGGTVAIGAKFNDGNGDDSGHVRIYQWDGSSWQQQGLDIDGEGVEDYSGYSVSMSADGGTVAIAAVSTGFGHVRIYEWNGSSWQQLGLDIDDEAYGGSCYSVSISANGDAVAIGTVNPYNASWGKPGHVRVYSLKNPLLPILDIDVFYESKSGQSLTVDATATDGYPRSFTYQWYFNYFAIPSSFGGTASAYTIDGLPDNEGTWKVAVTNDTGTSEAIFEFRIATDLDDDGLTYGQEVYQYFTDPDLEDTDGDGLFDGDEVLTYLTNPLVKDTDSDGIDDKLEVDAASYGFNALENSAAAYTQLTNIVSRMPGMVSGEQQSQLSLGGIAVSVSVDDFLNLDFVIEESEDLITWTPLETVSRSLDVTGATKKFIRVRKVDAPL
jgi:hypothetical protein